MLCRDPAYDGWFEVEATTCYAKQAMDAHDMKARQQDSEPEPGQVLFTVLPHKAQAAPNH